MRAGLRRDETAGGDVPVLDSHLVVGVEAAARHPAKVESGRAEAADVAHGWQDLGEDLSLARPLVAPVAESRRDQCSRQVGRAGHRHGITVAIRAAPGRRREYLVTGWIGDNADDGAPVELGGDGD